MFVKIMLFIYKFIEYNVILLSIVMSFTMLFDVSYVPCKWPNGIIKLFIYLFIIRSYHVCFNNMGCRIW